MHHHQIGIDKRILTHYTPSADSIVWKIDKFFDLLFKEQILESELPIVKFIVAGFIEGRYELYQLITSWSSNVDYVYLLKNKKITRAIVQDVIDNNRRLIMNNWEAIMRTCELPIGSSEDFEIFLMEFSRRRIPSANKQQISQQQQ